MLLAGYGNLDEQFSEYLRWIKWVVRPSAHHALARFAPGLPSALCRYFPILPAAVHLAVVVQSSVLMSSCWVVMPRVSASLFSGWGCQAGRSKLRTNNQWLSLTDQLRLGVRALELDTHYVQVRGRALPALYCPMAKRE